MDRGAASDAWEVFEREGALNVATGARYRKAILERGGSRPMTENFVEFVGRPPKIDAFLHQRGVAGAV
ncbi:M3 family metallopeptidase [Roseateles violae]|uniref:M3 family metallopeptidase n=1 Tax=Roseateles violae TaxID=3058042 RepID=A0ABT8DV13_9BURK|nr:M3 family metallopeptidase [Pelomonas sp. PFR6]MDN3922145.1 M3 family metallopeptidase [Pelomonas sp. PFR6]